ncbi:unnamed protein product [Musa hybrid cultivar]
MLCHKNFPWEFSNTGKKACTLINPPRQKNPQPEAHDPHRMALHGEVMACSYHDVQVMWSILDKSNPGEHGRR